MGILKDWLYWISPERFRIWNGCRKLNQKYGTRGNFSLKSCLWCYLTKKYPWCRNESLAEKREAQAVTDVTEATERWRLREIGTCAPWLGAQRPSNRSGKPIISPSSPRGR